MWKIVEALEASVLSILYIYIYIYITKTFEAPTFLHISII